MKPPTPINFIPPVGVLDVRRITLNPRAQTHAHIYKPTKGIHAVQDTEPLEHRGS